MKKLLLLVSSALGVITFIMMFSANLLTSTTVLGKTQTDSILWNNVLFGETNEILGQTFTINPAVLPFVGYLLVIISAVVILIGLLFLTNKAKIHTFINGLMGLILIMGGVFILMTKSVFSSANPDLMKFYDLTTTQLSMSAPIIIGGILAILGGLIALATCFLKEKKRKK